MAIFKFSPGRIGWIALLGLLGFVAPRVAVNPPFGSPLPAESRSPIESEQPDPLVKTRPAQPAPRRAANSLEPDGDLFSSGHLPRLSIELSRAEMSILKSYHWQWGGNARERRDAKATVREGEIIYTNVSIHLKGSAGSFRPVDDKPSLTLNFDKFAPGQRFHGLKKIHLNNSVQDSSYLSEQICRELFLEAGVPTTRATHAKLELNGRDLGVYVLVEGWNKQFLKRHFNQSNGVLYDGGFAKEITFPLEVMSGDESTDRSDLEELADAAQKLVSVPRGLDSRRRQELTRLAQARLEKILDLDRFISFIAMEALLAHADGYAMNRNNYRIYHDPQSGKFVFMPHGMDQMFGSWSSTPEHPIAPPMRGLIARVVMQMPEGRARYMARLGQLYTNVYQTDRILERMNELSARLRPLLAEGSIWSRPGQAHGVAELRRRIAERGKSIEAQLARSSAPLEFSQAGEVKLAGWERQTGRSTANYTEARGEDGHRLLKIKLQGSGYGSWRTQVLLEAGEYHFVGRAKVQGLAIDPSDTRSGVGLRLSGYRLENRLLNDTDWTEIDYAFDVQGISNIELICELKGMQGEAIFDANSLRLRRKN